MALERIAVASEPPVRGVLHPASGADGLVLTHGAGGNMDTPLLVAVADAFATRGVWVLRCNLPYRQARPNGPPSPSGAARDREGLRAALGVLRERATGHFYLGGHSYGGRMASMLVAEHAALVSGLLLQSYPVHPPGKPDNVRSAHLPSIRVPTLFVHGTTDPFGSPDEVSAVRALIPARTSALKVNGGHDLAWGDNKRDRDLPQKITTAFLDLMHSPSLVR